MYDIAKLLVYHTSNEQNVAELLHGIQSTQSGACSKVGVCWWFLVWWVQCRSCGWCMVDSLIGGCSWCSVVGGCSVMDAV
jgi:hypothetical protein